MTDRLHYHHIEKELADGVRHLAQNGRELTTVEEVLAELALNGWITLDIPTTNTNNKGEE